MNKHYKVWLFKYTLTVMFKYYYHRLLHRIGRDKLTMWAKKEVQKTYE